MYKEMLSVSCQVSIGLTNICNTIISRCLMCEYGTSAHCAPYTVCNCLDSTLFRKLTCRFPSLCGYLIMLSFYSCQSEVGMLRRTRVQVTWFLTGCLSEKGGNSVAHELMHTLGFYHEHTRPDRDEYITVR